MKPDMQFTSPILILKSGEELEADSATLYVDQVGQPQAIQLFGGKAPITLPWSSVDRIRHA